MISSFYNKLLEERILRMIRKMTVEDIPQVQHVARTSWHHTYEGIIPRHIQDHFLATAYNDENMVRRVERSHVFVALIEDKIVGFANFSYVKDDGTSELAIYLLPESQGKGLGTKLLEQGLELPKIKAVELSVEKNNVLGMNFYLAKGFKQIDAFKENFAGHEQDTIRMRLEV